MTGRSWHIRALAWDLPRVLIRALGLALRLAVPPALISASVACTSGRETPQELTHSPTHPVPRASADVRVAAADAGLSASTSAMRPPLSEAAARALLADRFRAAGLRIRYDVTVRRDGSFELTVDGYDPQAKIGFEYVASVERMMDLDANERDALESDSEHRILVVDEIDEGGLAEAAERFLAGVRPQAP